MDTKTLTVEVDTSAAEANLERLIALAERFKELWGDAPLPDGIERFTIAEGDRVVQPLTGRRMPKLTSYFAQKHGA